MTENKNQGSDTSSTVDSTPVTPASLTTEASKKEPDSSYTPNEQAKVKKPFKPRQTTNNTALSKSVLTASFIMSATAIAISGWFYQQTSQQTFQQDITQIAAQQHNLASQLKQQSISQTQISAVNEHVIKLELADQSQKSEFIDYQKEQSLQLQSIDTKLNRLSKTTKEDWKLAEADYLIRLANQRLLLESDNKSAATLLVNADTILNELKDPIVFDTRKALAKDIQSLQAISEFDLEGAYLKISALYESVAELPQREPSTEWQKAEEAEIANSTTATGTVLSTLDSFWKAIQSLVVINYHNKPIKTLLPPAQYQGLIAGLQLQLDVAQVALIKGESTIYQAALARIANAVTEHFDTHAESTVSFLSSLTAMQQINPSPELPQPRNSLIAMKSLMAAWIARDVLTPEPAVLPPIVQAPSQAESKPEIETVKSNEKATPTEETSDVEITTPEQTPEATKEQSLSSPPATASDTTINSNTEKNEDTTTPTDSSLIENTEVTDEAIPEELLPIEPSTDVTTTGETGDKA